MDLPSLTLGMNDTGTVSWKHPYTHLTCLGKSGTGKSSLMTNMIRQDSYYPVAKIIVDPSGFLAKDVWAISKGKALYLSSTHPLPLNPMKLPYDADVISDLVAESINQVVEQTTATQALTSKMRAILDGAVKWNLERNRKSLIHVRDYIENLKGDTQTRDGILARLNFLTNNRAMEEIICGNNSINIPELIDQGKTLIMDLHGLSEEKMIFTGTLLLNQVKSHFRFSSPRKYKPLRVYIDEAHNFLSLNILSILKEARKFRFSFVMMTVDFSNIGAKLVHSVMNVGTLVCFRVGAREAQLFAREMSCDPQELMFLPKHHLGYMTPIGRGICKASRPPYVKPLEPPKGEPQRKQGWKGWFSLEDLG